MWSLTVNIVNKATNGKGSFTPNGMFLKRLSVVLSAVCLWVQGACLWVRGVNLGPAGMSASGSVGCTSTDTPHEHTHTPPGHPTWTHTTTTPLDHGQQASDTHPNGIVSFFYRKSAHHYMEHETGGFPFSMRLFLYLT